jgi:hypothetical protein
MKVKIVKAVKDDIDAIYLLWGALTKKRLFGLNESIMRGDVWLFCNFNNKKSKKVLGFCRYNSKEGIRLDYVKFTELVVAIELKKNEYNKIFNDIDDLILGLGFYESRAYVSNSNICKILLKNNWKIIENKFISSKKGNQIFVNFILERNIDGEAVRNRLKKFGSLIKG